MTGSRRRFTVTVPDWGQDCLSSEVVAAYVDNELAPGPRARAAMHLGSCADCSAQVRAHGQASVALRTAQVPCLPSSLMSALRSIPQDTDLPGPPAGLAVTADGHLVEVLRPEMTPAAPAISPTSPPAHRMLRIGAAAAVSGLALGALAFGVTAVSSGPVPDQNTARGVFNGPVVQGTVDARLRLTPDRAELSARFQQVARSYLLHP